MNPKIYRCNACGIEGTKRMESIEMFPDNNTTLNYKLTPFQIHDHDDENLRAISPDFDQLSIL